VQPLTAPFDRLLCAEFLVRLLADRNDVLNLGALAMVAYSIYELRSTTCRDFVAGSDQCNQARRAHGLLTIEAAASH
jgi:hypothetical protein